MAQKDFPEGCALIFGGSGGIGRGVAAEFGRAGTGVAICYRSKEAEAKATAAEIQGVKTSVHAVDVTDPAQVEAALAEAIAAHGRVHTVVWGAGPLAHQVHLSELTPDQWRRAFDVEVFGFFTTARAALPHFREAGGGSFVHLGSAGDRRWPPLDGLSVAPKATNESLIKGIAKEEGRFNIRANSVLVGVIEAGMFLELRKQGHFDDAWATEVHKNLCLKRFGKPEDIGAAAVFLASNRAGYITGEQISVAGGYGV